MTESTQLRRTSATARMIAKLESGEIVFDADAVAKLAATALAEDGPLGDKLDALIAKQADESLVTVFASAEMRIEQLTSSLRWTQRLMENAIAQRLHARRIARGGENDTAPIAIAHPLVDATLETVFGAYQIDEDAIETVLPQLPEDEQRKLMIIEPEHAVPEQIIPAHIVPRRVVVGNTTSILALKKRYAGSAVGMVLDAAITRPKINDKITIKPKKKPAPARVSGVAQ